MKLITTLVFISFGAHANPTATTAATTDTPLAVCKKLVEMTVKKDFAAVKDLSLHEGGMHKGKMNEKKFDKMHGENMAKLENTTCTTEMVASDRAFVTAKSTEGERFIPFVKTEAGWKFDGMTYMSFYGHGKKGHRGKGKM